VNLSNKPSYEYIDSILLYNEGNLFWKYREDRNKTWNTRFSGKIAGSINKPNKNKDYYRKVVNIDGQMIKVHHIVWLLNTGDWPTMEIDHKDRNSLNNNFNNLELSNRSLQSRNSRIRKDNNSGSRGVSFMSREKKYKAEIMVDKKLKYLGSGSLEYCIELRKKAELNYW